MIAGFRVDSESKLAHPAYVCVCVRIYIYMYIYIYLYMYTYMCVCVLFVFWLLFAPMFRKGECYNKTLRKPRNL